MLLTVLYPAWNVPPRRRGDWTQDACFVGHAKTVVAVRFNPRFYFPRKPGGNPDDACYVAGPTSSRPLLNHRPPLPLPAPMLVASPL